MKHWSKIEVGDLVRCAVMPKLGIVKSIKVLGTKKWMCVEWFSSMEETMDEMWELISIEEIDND